MAIAFYFQHNIDRLLEEVKLRAVNNYGDFTYGEQVEINVNRAIQELADELKESGLAAEIVGEILEEYNLLD